MKDCWKIPFFLLLSLILTGCSQMGGGLQAENRHTINKQNCAKTADADTSMNLDLIEQLMASGRLYAALAHLDNLQSESIYAVYLRAEILRQSGRDELASEHYHALLNTCMVGEGHHGLGLIAGRNQQLHPALEHLMLAAKQLPVDARVRNDLGYALLLSGQYEQAQREFLTALELDEEALLTESNMMLSLLVMGEEDKAKSYAERIYMDTQTIAELRQQALVIRTQSSSR